MRQIESAKDQWAIEQKKTTGDTVADTDVAPYIKGGYPTCPASGSYTIGTIGTNVSCSVHGALPTS